MKADPLVHSSSADDSLGSFEFHFRGYLFRNVNVGRGRGMAQQRQELSMTQKREKKREETKEENQQQPKIERENEASSDTDETVSASEGEEEEEEVNELDLYALNHPKKMEKAKRFITIGVVGHPVCDLRNHSLTIHL